MQLCLRGKLLFLEGENHEVFKRICSGISCAWSY